MARGVRDSYGSTLGHPKQREAIDLHLFHYSFEIADPLVEAYVHDRSVGEAAATLVKPNQPVRIC
jgi:hypothetical protein